MKLIQWTASGHRPNRRRVLSTQDLAALGIERSEDMVFSRENGFTLELSNQAGDLLVKRLPEEFLEVSSDDVEDYEEGSSESSSVPSNDESSEANPEGRSSGSQDDETPDKVKSPHKRSS